MTTQDAILAVLRNGRERHTGEIAERLHKDHGIKLGAEAVAAHLRRTPGVVKTGILKKLHSHNTTWRLDE